MTFNFYETETYKEIAEQQEHSVKAKSVDLSKEYSFGEIWHDVIKSKGWKSTDRVVITDADMLCYRVSAASDRRYIKVSVGNKTIEFDTRTKFKEYCKEWSLDFNDYVITDCIDAEPVEYCLGTLKKALKNIKENLQATYVIHILSGSGNYRLDLPLIDKYKSNRKDMVKPTHLLACREYLIKWHGAYVINGDEADSPVQNITAHLINNTSAYAVAYSLDKDYHTSLVKNRYYNPMTDSIVELDGGLGCLRKTDKGVKGDGLFWICYQLMMGDSSDGYAPKRFYNKRYGDVGFYNDFKDCQTEHELLTKVVAKCKDLIGDSVEYTSWCGKEMKLSWLELLELYFSCLYMRGVDDNTTFESLLIKYEVDYE